MATPQITPTKPSSDSLFVVTVLGCYLIVTAFVVTFHEPWRDEADAWLVSRDASLPQLFTLTRYMGTPALWYLILIPFAKAGLPYFALHVVHLALAAAGVAIFLNYAPFSRLTRVLLVFSYYIAYEYAIVARSYVLTALLLWTTAALYPSRLRRPIAYATALVLLFNANVHSFFFAAAIGVVFAWDILSARPLTRRHTAALAIVAIGALVAFLQVLPPKDGQLTGLFNVRNAEAFSKIATHVFIQPLYTPFLRQFALPATVFVLVTTILELLFKPRALFILIAALTALAYIFVFQWIGGLRHAGLVFLLVFFCKWIGHDEPDPAGPWAASDAIKSFREKVRLAATAAINGTLLCSCLAMINAARFDIKEPYSFSTQVAEMLNALDTGGFVIAADFWGTSILPQLRDRRQLWYADLGQWGSHNTWDANYIRNAATSAPELLLRTRRAFPNQQKLLVILHTPLLDAEPYGFHLIYATTGTVGISGEYFFVYLPLGAALPPPRK